MSPRSRRLESGEEDDLARTAPDPSAVAAGARGCARRLPGDITIDVDATLLNVHSDKQDAASTYKRGYGFHPLGAWCDTTNEPLAAMLRPGNAGSNDTDDHSSCWTRQWRCSRPTTGPARAGDDPALCVTDPAAGRLGRSDHGFVTAFRGHIEYRSVTRSMRRCVKRCCCSRRRSGPGGRSDGTVRDGAFVPS